MRQKQKNNFSLRLACVGGALTAENLKKIAEVAEKYGMSTANVGVIVKTKQLTKVKVGVRNLLLKEEIDGVMAERMAQFGSYIIA